LQVLWDCQINGGKELKQITIQVEVESVYIDTKGKIVANIQIKQKQLKVRSIVIDVSQLLRDKPPK